VAEVGAHLAAGLVDPPFELFGERVDETVLKHRLRCQLALVPTLDPVGNGVVVAPRELGGVAIRPGQIEGFKYFHDLLVRLHVWSHLRGRWFVTNQPSRRGHTAGRRGPAFEPR
jgi:hypothetical protein